MKHGHLLSKIGLMVAVMFLVSVSVCPAMAAEHWQITTVESSTDPDGALQYPMLVFDNLGNPHISFFDAANEEIKYASLDNGVWFTEMVAGTDGTYSTSLAFDSAGYPAISYGDGYKRGNLMYASRDPSGWSLDKVDNGGGILGNVGQYSSLVFDPSGIPHISYRGQAGGNLYSLKYATKAGDTWQISTIDDAGGSFGDAGYSPSLVMDESGRPMVAYTEGKNPGTLKFAVPDIFGKWQLTKVDSGWGIDTGIDPSIALDSWGRPHISYYDKTHRKIMYAHLNGPIWDLETVDATGNAGTRSAIAVDANDQPFISYYDGSGRELRLATRDPETSKWSASTVDTGGVGEYSSLAFDPYGGPAVVYSDATNHSLKYAGWIG